MFKAMLFDFDGTIANTIPAIREGVNATMRAFGYPEHTDEEVLSFINYGARKLISQAMPRHLQGDAETVDRVLAEYNKQYGMVYDHTRKAYDGIPELIERLHRRGVRIGVLSNKQDAFVRTLSEQVLLPGTYDAVHGVGPDQPAKPDPFLPQLIASELGVSLTDCVMIGDSDVDILTAKNAGMAHVGVAWGYRSADFLSAHGADRIAHSVSELACLLGLSEKSEQER